MDLFVTRDGQNNSLYRNDGNGTFTKITSGSPVNDVGASYGCSWGDYDNDGDLDLFVANGGGLSASQNNFLYRNDGNGQFTKITTDITVTDGGKSACGTWDDYDNDGYLDLFVANDGQNNALYKNNRNGSFTKITTGSIVNDGGASLNASWGDYDNDGDQDLYVSNGGFVSAMNFLYNNNGNGTFTKITTGDLVNDVAAHHSSNWIDYDNDGDLDLFVANLNAKSNLYANNGNVTFTKITTGAIVNNVGFSIGSCWGDFDNDGDLDLFVANVQNQNNFFYQNNGDGTFTQVTGTNITADSGNSFGCSAADYDNDGDVDLLVTNGGFLSNGNNFLYRNNGNTNRWINILCAGTASNSSAIGAKVHVKATINGKAVWQIRQISGQPGFLGQNSLNVEFGLGNATVIDSLVVQWPSGKKLVRTNVAPNQFLKLVEESTTAVSDEHHPATPSRYRLAGNYPNPFGSGTAFPAAGTAIEFELPRAGAVKLEIYDLLGQKIRTLVDQSRTAGIHRVVWDGRNDLGKTVASGIYLYGMATADFKATKRLLLIR